MGDVKKLTYIYLQLIIQFQSMLVELYICKVLTSTTNKKQQNSTKTILANWKIVNDRHSSLGPSMPSLHVLVSRPC